MNQLKVGVVLSYVTIVLQIVIALTYTPYMLRMLGQSEYGLYSLAASVVAYLTVLDLGFGNAVIRYTAKFRAEGRTREQEEMFGMFFLIYVCIGIITLIGGGILTLNVENLFDRAMTPDEVDKTRIMMWLLVANLAFTFPMSVWGSVINAYERFIFLKTISVVRSVVNPLAIVVLLAMGYKAIALVVVTTVFNVITLLINWWYCRRKLCVRLRFARFNWDFLKEVSLFSFWIFLVVIMDKVYWNTGQFVLGMLRGTIAVAIYALAIQLQNMFITFSAAISTVILPRVTSMVAKGSSESDISDMFIKVGRLQFIVVSLIISGFIVFGQDFINIWAGRDYSKAYIICLIFFIPMMIDLIQNTGLVILQARNNMRFRGLLCIILGLGCFALSFPLALWWGETGCAIAVAIALVAGQGIAMNIYYYSRQAIDIPHFWAEIAKMSIVPIAFTFLSMLLIRHFGVEMTSFAALACGILIYIMLYLPAFWVFSMNDYEHQLFLRPIKNFINKRSLKR